MKVYRFLFALGLCLSLAVGSMHTQALYRRNPQASKGMTPEEKEAYTLRRQGESAQREKEVLRRFPNFKTLDAALNNPEGWSYQFITTYAMPDLERGKYSGPQIQQWVAHLANFLKNIQSDLNKGTLSRELLQSRANAVIKELQQIAPRLNQAFQDIIFNPLKSKADLAAGKTQAVAEEVEEEETEEEAEAKQRAAIQARSPLPVALPVEKRTGGMLEPEREIKSAPTIKRQNKPIEQEASYQDIEAELKRIQDMP